MRILCVDPDVIDRFIVKKVLGEYHTVITLSSAKEALAFAASFSFDIAILNKTLVIDMDAIFLLNELKLINPHPFYAIVTSSHIDEPRMRCVFNAGFNVLLIKPFTYEKFLSALKKAQISIFSDPTFSKKVLINNGKMLMEDQPLLKK